MFTKVIIKSVIYIVLVILLSSRTIIAQNNLRKKNKCRIVKFVKPPKTLIEKIQKLANELRDSTSSSKTCPHKKLIPKSKRFKMLPLNSESYELNRKKYSYISKNLALYSNFIMNEK